MKNFVISEFYNRESEQKGEEVKRAYKNRKHLNTFRIVQTVLILLNLRKKLLSQQAIHV